MKRRKQTEFSNELLEKMKNVSWKQRDLCAKFGISSTTVSHWCCGENSPPKWIQKLLLKRIRGKEIEVDKAMEDSLIIKEIRRKVREELESNQPNIGLNKTNQNE